MKKKSSLAIKEDNFQQSKLPSKHRQQNIADPNDNDHDSSKPSISPTVYSIVAASKLSKGIKEKKRNLTVCRRKGGDWGLFELSHIWCPQECNEEATRANTTANDLFVNMARPYVMEPILNFQVVLVHFCCIGCFSPQF